MKLKELAFNVLSVFVLAIMAASMCSAVRLYQNVILVQRELVAIRVDIDALKKSDIVAQRAIVFVHEEIKAVEFALELEQLPGVEVELAPPPSNPVTYVPPVGQGGTPGIKCKHDGGRFIAEDSQGTFCTICGEKLSK